MRKPRILLPGAVYHVSARANRQEMVLEPSSVKSLFEEILKKAKTKFEFRLHDFSIMGNHFHLVIQPSPGTSLSSIMQWVMSVFAQKWNRLHGIHGHVWGERFFSKVLDSLSEVARTIAYVALNPVRVGLARVPEEWRFGGAYHRKHGWCTGPNALVDP